MVVAAAPAPSSKRVLGLVEQASPGPGLLMGAGSAPAPRGMRAAGRARTPRRARCAPLARGVQADDQQVVLDILEREEAEEGVWALSGQLVAVPPSAVVALVDPARIELTQRQDTVGNPHSEHAHSVVVIRGVNVDAALNE